MRSTEELLAEGPTERPIVVLLVDDQPIVAGAIDKLLEGQSDIELHYCRDPRQAVDKALALSPTVILQDLIMPDIDGLALVKAYRARPELEAVPVIVLSAKGEAIVKADAFEIGADDYLVKLPDRVELIARIRHHSHAYNLLLQRNEAYAALSESQRILALELQRASQYVASLLPPPIEEGAVSTEWRFFPSTQLGGDSFGHSWIDDDHFAVYLLDVCDHGVGSALLSVSVLNVLNAQALPNTDFREPAAVLSALNEAFQMEEHDDLFFTIWYGVWSPSRRELRYASGGHPPALLLAGDAEPVELRTANALIGAMRGVHYEEASLAVPRCATLYVFSDGAYEVADEDGVEWSLADLAAFLAAPPAADLPVIERLYRHLVRRNGGQTLADDFSVVKLSLG